MNRRVFITNGLALMAAGIVSCCVEHRGYGANEVPRTAAEAIVYLTCVLAILTGFVLCVVGQAMSRR